MESDRISSKFTTFHHDTFDLMMKRPSETSGELQLIVNIFNDNDSAPYPPLPWPSPFQSRDTRAIIGRFFHGFPLPDHGRPTLILR